MVPSGNICPTGYVNPVSLVGSTVTDSICEESNMAVEDLP